MEGSDRNMRRIKTIGLALAAMCAITALTATALVSTATAALPEILPEPTAGENVLFTGKGKEGELSVLKAGVEPVKCKENTIKGDATSLKLGTVEIKFKGCTSLAPGGITINCTELAAGAETGLIVVKNADFHFWYALLSGVKQKALVVLVLENLHFVCGTAVLVEVLAKSCIAGLVLENSVDKLVSKVEVRFLKENTGDPDMPKVLNEASEDVTCELKVDVIGEATMGAINEVGDVVLENFEKDLAGGAKDKITVLLDA
jgi:hypothetical protein